MKMKTQNLRDTAKVVLRGKLIALNIHIRKEERPKIKSMFPPRKIEKKKRPN